jgi:hypothetical protein
MTRETSVVSPTSKLLLRTVCSHRHTKPRNVADALSLEVFRIMTVSCQVCGVMALFTARLRGFDACGFAPRSDSLAPDRRAKLTAYGSHRMGTATTYAPACSALTRCSIAYFQCLNSTALGALGCHRSVRRLPDAQSHL